MDLQIALNATVFGRPEDTAADVARYFDPEYTQITDGVVSDYDQFVAHIAHVRRQVVSGDLVVHEQAREADVVADRHTVSVTMRDGGTSSFEVLLVGRVAPDGRLRSVVETTRQLTGPAADAGLGSAG